MGSGASKPAPKATVLSPDNLPKQLIVEGAGSVRGNGKFLLRTDNFPAAKVTRKAVCDCSAWFCKEDDEGCWIGFVDARKSDGGGDSDERKWVICTDQEILYMAPITDEEITPRQGRWELGDDGASPPPTVNLQPLPTAFRMTGWKGPSYCLNGEYLPLDDGTKLINGRPVFKHTPVVGLLGHQETWKMYWSHGAWCIDEKGQIQP